MADKQIHRDVAANVVDFIRKKDVPAVPAESLIDLVGRRAGADRSWIFAVLDDIARFLEVEEQFAMQSVIAEASEKLRFLQP